MFEVVDTGSGFDADGEAVMFKPFSQVDASVSPPFFQQKKNYAMC